MIISLIFTSFKWYSNVYNELDIIYRFDLIFKLFLSIPIDLKKLWIRWELCSPSVSSIEEGWLRMLLELIYRGQSKTKCFIDRGSLHWLQTGCIFCSMMCLCVRLVWPILVLVLITSDCLEALGYYLL